MTLLESDPLRNGLRTSTNGISQMMVNSCTSSQREMLTDMLGAIPNNNHNGRNKAAAEADIVVTSFANNGGASNSSSVIVGVGSPKAGVGDLASSSGNASFLAVHRKTKTLSHCNCQLVSYDSQFLLCSYAKQWLSLIEQRTDQEVNYQQSSNLY